MGIKNWLAWWPHKKPDTGMRRRSVQCLGSAGLYDMSYVEWGVADNPLVLVCVHGLTRNARDFDDLARALQGEYRVVCPDVAGRGHSDWLKLATDYAVPHYVSAMVTLLARLDAQIVDWVGTSMGGLIGMGLAAQAKSPIRKLVLNDVGAVIPALALNRIGEYVGRAPSFGSLAEADAYVRRVSADFGPLSDTQWRHLAEHSVKPEGAGFVMRYDPAIGDAFRSVPQLNDLALWPIYDAIHCPTLLLRGANSDLLSSSVADQMRTRGPRAQVVEFPGVGHAPVLMDEAQIAPIRRFLLEP